MKISGLNVNEVLKMLPDLDSNQDKQNQNLSYYHYTIGQPNWVAKISDFKRRSQKL